MGTVVCKLQHSLKDTIRFFNEDEWEMKTIFPIVAHFGAFISSTPWNRGLLSTDFSLGKKGKNYSAVIPHIYAFCIRTRWQDPTKIPYLIY